MSGVCPSGSIDLFLFVSCPFVKSFPLWEVNQPLRTAFSLLARNRSFSTSIQTTKGLFSRLRMGYDLDYKSGLKKQNLKA